MSSGSADQPGSSSRHPAGGRRIKTKQNVSQTSSPRTATPPSVPPIDEHGEVMQEGIHPDHGQPGGTPEAGRSAPVTPGGEDPPDVGQSAGRSPSSVPQGAYTSSPETINSSVSSAVRSVTPPHGKRPREQRSENSPRSSPSRDGDAGENQEGDGDEDDARLARRRLDEVTSRGGVQDFPDLAARGVEPDDMLMLDSEVAMSREGVIDLETGPPEAELRP